MIYSGYECGHFYVRLTHDIRVLDAVEMFQNGYKLVNVDKPIVQVYYELVPKSAELDAALSRFAKGIKR